MQRYLCIFDLAGTNKVIPAEQPLRHLQHSIGQFVLLRFERNKAARPRLASRRDAGSDARATRVRGLRTLEGGLSRREHASGDPGAIRTRDPQIRNLMLYPAELRDHGTSLSKIG